MKRVLFAAAAVALLAVLAWLVLDADGEAPAAAPAVVEPATTPGASPAVPAAGAAAGARPIDAPADTGRTAGGGDADLLDFEGPIVARGRIVSDLVLPLDELEIVLYDAEGEDLNWAAVASDGSFEVRWDQALRAGWAVSSAAAEIARGGEPVSLLPSWCGPHGDHAPGDPAESCTLRVRAAPTIVGTVLDAVTGAPIEGAEITVGSTLAAFALDESWSETDDLGRYRMQAEDLPPSGALVWCREWEHQAAVQGPFDLADHDVLQVDFHLSPIRALEGVVVDGATGRPVPDAPVTLGSSWPAFEDDEDWDFTDEEGRFRLEASDLPLDGAWVHVEGVDGYGAASMSVPPADTGPLQVALGPLQHLRGLVVDARELPVPGADVHVVFHEGFLGIEAGLANGGSTGADGAFALELDTAPPEASRLVVLSDGHRPYTARLADVAERGAAENTWFVQVVLEAVGGD